MKRQQQQQKNKTGESEKGDQVVTLLVKNTCYRKLYQRPWLSSADIFLKDSQQPVAEFTLHNHRASLSRGRPCLTAEQRVACTLCAVGAGLKQTKPWRR